MSRNRATEIVGAGLPRPNLICFFVRFPTIKVKLFGLPVWHFCDDGVAQFRHPLCERDPPFETTTHVKSEGKVATKLLVVGILRIP